MAKRGKKEKIKTGHLQDVPVFSILDKKNVMLNAFKDAIKPLAPLDLDEWSDEYRHLPRETSSEYGRWYTSRFPFLKRLMKCLSPSSKAEEIVAIKGCQLGFTEVCINWIMYIADRCPAPTMYVQKTCDAGEEFGTQKLTPNIEICDQVYDKLGDGKPSHLVNSSKEKGYPGGFLVLGGANSGAFLRSKSLANAMSDEEDSFKAAIDGEGSPIGMIRMRQNNFPMSKLFRLSTPKYTETSTIVGGYQEGSMEQFYVPCPHCNPTADRHGTRFVIEWGNIVFSKERDDAGKPVDVHLLCKTCGSEIYEGESKDFMLENGIWMSRKDPEGTETLVEPYEVGDVGLPSFQISSLYSPLGFKSWGDCVQDFWRYKDTGDKALLQTFINQILGETYDAAGQDIDYNWLMSRKEDYGAMVPEEVLCLTAGVDVQADRLEMEILGHGIDGETWSIDYVTLWGNTSDMGDNDGLDHNGNPTCWKMLDDYLHAEYEKAEGGALRIECTFIDAGYDTKTVHSYCRFRERIRAYPTKGVSGWGKGYIDRNKRRTPEFHTLYPKTFVDEMKKHTYDSLRVSDPGRGFCHFPKRETYDKKYFAGLVAETLKPVMVSGSKVMKWECPSGARNEPLDIRNYAYAAFLFYAPNMTGRATMKEGSFKDVNPAQVVNNPRAIPTPPTNKVTGGRRKIRQKQRGNRQVSSGVS